MCRTFATSQDRPSTRLCARQACCICPSRRPSGSGVVSSNQTASVAFSTMRVGSPSSGRVFRECAARFGLDVEEPSEALGTEDRCRHVLEEAGFDRLRVIPGRVDFEILDPALAWEANFRAAGHAAARALNAEQPGRPASAVHRRAEAGDAGGPRRLCARRGDLCNRPTCGSVSWWPRVACRGRPGMALAFDAITLSSR